MSTIVDINSARGGRDGGQNFTALKLAAVDRLLLDRRATDLDFRVFWYLVSAADRETCVACRRQETIANAVGRTRRAVQISLDRLKNFSYIIFETKEGGTYAKGYRILLGKTNVDSSLSDTKANGPSPILNTKTNVGSPFGKKRRTGPAKKANSDAKKGEPPFAPILPLNTFDIPSRARKTNSANALGPAFNALNAALGADKFAAWFSDVTAQLMDGETIILQAETKFRRDYIEAQFFGDILRAFQVFSPEIKFVHVVVASQVRA